MQLYDATAAPSVYDIVWCKWPYRERPDIPGPVARCVLILDVRLMIDAHDETEWAAVTVAYGTGAEHVEAADLTNNLLIPDTECRARGLHKATVFKLDVRNRKRLPWAEDYFVTQGYVRSQKLIAGSLNEQQQATFHECFKQRGLAFPLP